MRIPLLVLTLALIPAATLHARRQPVQIDPARDAGATWLYRLSAETALEQQGARSVVSHEARLALRFTGEQTRGLDIIDVRLLDLSLDMETPDADYALRAARAETGVEATPDDAPEDLVAVMRAMLDAPVRLAIAPDGRVQAVQGLDGVGEAIEQGEALTRLAVGVFHPETLAAALEPLFFADDADAEPRAPGDAWTTTSRRPLGEGRTIVEEAAFTFAEGPAWRGELAISVEHADDLPATSARVEVIEQSGEIDARWNTDAGALASRTRTLRTALRWLLGDITISQEQTTTITLERIEGEVDDALFKRPDRAPGRRQIEAGG